MVKQKNYGLVLEIVTRRPFTEVLVARLMNIDLLI